MEPWQLIGEHVETRAESTLDLEEQDHQSSEDSENEDEAGEEGGGEDKTRCSKEG